MIAMAVLVAVLFVCLMLACKGYDDAQAKIGHLEAELADAVYFRERVNELGFTDTDDVKHAAEDLERLREGIQPRGPHGRFAKREAK